MVSKSLRSRTQCFRQRPKNKTEKSRIASGLARGAKQTPTPSPVWGRTLVCTFPGIRVQAGDVWSCHGDCCQQRLPPWNLFDPVTHTQSWNNRLCKWLLLCKQRQGCKSIINELGDIDIHPHLISTAQQPEEKRGVCPAKSHGLVGNSEKEKTLGTKPQRGRDDGLQPLNRF